MAAAVFVSRTICVNPAKDVLLRSSLLLRNPMVNQSKGLANNARPAFRRANVGRSPTLKERLFAPQQGTGELSDIIYNVIIY